LVQECPVEGDDGGTAHGHEELHLLAQHPSLCLVVYIEALDNKLLSLARTRAALHNLRARVFVSTVRPRSHISRAQTSRHWGSVRVQPTRSASAAHSSFYRRRSSAQLLEDDKSGGVDLLVKKGAGLIPHPRGVDAHGAVWRHVRRPHLIKRVLLLQPRPTTLQARMDNSGEPITTIVLVRVGGTTRLCNVPQYPCS
jgi:hypothetical protein